jgi:hypothetical protein
MPPPGRSVPKGPYAASHAASSERPMTVSKLNVGNAIYVEPIAAAGHVFVLTDNAQLVAIR